MSLASACSGSIKEVHCKLNVINAEIKWALVISPHSLKAILFLFFKKIPLNFKHNIIGKLHPSGISNWRCPINTLKKKSTQVPFSFMQSACSNLHHKISLLGSVHVSALLCQIITNLTSIKERTSLTRDSTGSRGNQLLETGLWKETHVAGWNLWKQQSLCDEHHVFLFIFLHTLLDAQHCTKI